MKYSPTACIGIVVSLALAASSQAGEPQVYTYHFSVAGVVCGACSKVVKDTVGKVDGITSVKIRKTATGELPMLTVESTSSTLDAAALQAALGSANGHYQILERNVVPHPQPQ